MIYAQTEPDTLHNVQSDTSAFVMTKSPWGAVLRSAVIPGWGQFYNESYLKIPVVLGVMGYCVYGYVHNNNQYHNYSNLYNQIIVTEGYDRYNYERLREDYHDRRDLFAVYMGLAYVLNLIDAYVDAQLFDFTVEENRYYQSPELKIKLKL